LDWTITVVAVPIISRFSTAIPHLGFRSFAGPMLAQLVIVTIVFTAVDWFQRLSRRPPARRSLPNWRFPPTYLQCIPRWQSLVGVILFGILTVWWALIPIVPSLMLGPASASLEFTASTSTLYWAVLALLLVSAGQRAATLARPDWNWLQAVTRLITNGSALMLLYPFAMSFPYVLASASAPDLESAELLAHRINSTLWLVTLGTMSIYWLCNTAFHVWVCAQFLRYAG